MKSIFLFIVIFIVSACSRDRDAIDTTLEWSCIKSLPANAKVESVEELGSIFTREFRITFTADVKDIESWLVENKIVSPEYLKYRFTESNLKTCGGAQHSSLKINWEKKKVLIRAYWS